MGDELPNNHMEALGLIGSLHDTSAIYIFGPELSFRSKANLKWFDWRRPFVEKSSSGTETVSPDARLWIY